MSREPPLATAWSRAAERHLPHASWEKPPAPGLCLDPGLRVASVLWPPTSDPPSLPAFLLPGRLGAFPGHPLSSAPGGSPGSLALCAPHLFAAPTSTLDHV